MMVRSQIKNTEELPKTEKRLKICTAKKKKKGKKGNVSEAVVFLLAVNFSPAICTNRKSEKATVE